SLTASQSQQRFASHQSGLLLQHYNNNVPGWNKVNKPLANIIFILVLISCIGRHTVTTQRRVREFHFCCRHNAVTRPKDRTRRGRKRFKILRSPSIENSESRAPRSTTWSRER